jgi:hypothetical protein
MCAIRLPRINRRKLSITSLLDQSAHIQIRVGGCNAVDGPKGKQDVELFFCWGPKVYWLLQTPYQRLKAVETLRQINYGYHKSSARLQRILEIAEHAPG